MMCLLKSCAAKAVVVVVVVVVRVRLSRPCYHHDSKLATGISSLLLLVVRVNRWDH